MNTCTFPSGIVLLYLFTKYVGERCTVLKANNWILFLDVALSHHITL